MGATCGLSELPRSRRRPGLPHATPGV